MKNPKPLLAIVIVALLSLSFDQLTKYWAILFLKNPLKLTSFFSLQYEQNYGIAWSIPVPYPLLIVLNLLLLLIIPLYLSRALNTNLKTSQVLLGLLLGGALGNIIDRLWRGFVVDFIAIGNFPVFNLADTFITVSIFIILIFYDRIARKS